MTGTGLVDRLVNEFIRPGHTDAEKEPELAERVLDVLEPLDLVARDNGQLVLRVDISGAAGEIMNRVRKRDKTPETERGRPADVEYIAAQTAKSPLGLSPELFELVLAALLKTGMLVAVIEDGGSIRFEDIPSSVREGVRQVARAPILGMSDWKTLTRISKLVLDITVPRPDHVTQAAIFQKLVEARDFSLRRISTMRQWLQELIEKLDQSPRQWEESMNALDEMEKFFRIIDPDALPAGALQKVVEQGEKYLQSKAGPTRLAVLLREIDAIWEFLENWSDDVVEIRRYLNSPDLNLQNDLDLRTRRKRLLDMIQRGEEVISDSSTLQRLTQIFMATYKRRYMTWHNRCYRSSIFEQYRSLRNSPELRALALLQRLNLEVEEDTARAFEVLEAEMDRRCTFEDLNSALDEQPVCPQCGLTLDEAPELVQPEEILEMARAGLHEYVEMLRKPEFTEALQDYGYGLPSRGELAARLERVAHLDDRPNARQILTLFSDELINHINRMLSGKRMKPRNFAQLREALSGRTLTKDEARRLFKQWLEDQEDDDNGDELIHIVP